MAVQGAICDVKPWSLLLYTVFQFYTQLYSVSKTKILVWWPLSMKDRAETEIFEWSSDIVTKQPNILTCSAYTMPKGQCILGALTVHLRKKLSFDTWVKCFGREMSFCKTSIVLWWTIRLFCQIILEFWECNFCFKKWAKPMEKNYENSDSIMSYAYHEDQTRLLIKIHLIDMKS